MRDADRYDAAGPWKKGVGTSVEDERRLALRDVEALFERVDVRIDVAFSLNGTQPKAHVNGSDVRVDKRTTGEEPGVIDVLWRRLNLGGGKEMVHGVVRSRRRSAATRSKVSRGATKRSKTDRKVTLRSV